MNKQHTPTLELLEVSKSMLSALLLVDARLDVEATEAGENDYILGGCHTQIKERIVDAQQAIKKAEG